MNFELLNLGYTISILCVLSGCAVDSSY